MVWSRKDRLKFIASDTVVRSKILAGAQKPARLANGAIAKGISGVVSVKPPSFPDLNINATQGLTVLDEGNNRNKDNEMDSNKLDLTNLDQTQICLAISHQPFAASGTLQDVGCPPEKKRKPGEGLVSHQSIRSGLISKSSGYSGKATIVSSNVVPINPDQTHIKGAFFISLPSILQKIINNFIDNSFKTHTNIYHYNKLRFLSSVYKQKPDGKICPAIGWYKWIGGRLTYVSVYQMPERVQLQ